MNNIEQIKQRIVERKRYLADTTASPWYVSFLDDSFFMNCVAVTTKPVDYHAVLPLDDEDESIRNSIVATTLLQADIGKEDPFVVVDVDEYAYDQPDKGGRWDEDAAFIAFARNDAEQAIEDMELLLSMLEKNEKNRSDK